MNIVQDGDEELVDYVLKFGVDIHHKIKTGENVLFFCKSVKMFNKFYDLGVDIHAINENIGRNILAFLASKKIFNAELYQRLIDDGIDINQKDTYGIVSYPHGNYYNALVGSILNKNAVELLIKNGAELNDDIQEFYLNKLFDAFRYFKNKKSIVVKIFEILFKNGMKVIDEKDFGKKLNFIDGPDDSVISNFIKPLKNYLTENIIIAFYNSNNFFSFDETISLLSVDMYPELWKIVKRQYGEKYKIAFADFLQKYPYDTIDKYNL